MSRKNPFFVGTGEQEYLNTIVMEQNEKTDKVKDAEKALNDAYSPPSSMVGVRHVQACLWRW